MKCPNCGAEIKRFDISENCKHCGINLFYSQQETLLSQDAKRCELEFASFRVFVAKLKTAFIGSKLVIARLVFSVLCVAMLLIPFGNVSLKLPLVSKALSLGGIGLYSAFSDGTLTALFSFLKMPIAKDIAVKCFALIGILALTALVSVALLLLELLSFINIQKTAKGMKITSLIGMIFAVISVIFSTLLALSAVSSTVTCSFGFGGIVCLVFYGVMFYINATVVKKAMKPEVSEIDLKRIELNKKVKKGEISLDDLSLPVFFEPKKEPVKKEKKKFGRRKKK